MTRTISDMPVEELVAAFIEQAEFQRLAIRDQKIPKANRHMDKVVQIRNALDETPEGRQALLKLVNNEARYVQLRAARPVIDWAPDIAVPVLGRLLIEDFGDKLTDSEGIELRISAKEILFNHFGIENFDRNELIEPLRAYGIEIPRRHRA